MLYLYIFIFAKAYYFCINVFKESEFPQYWAGGVVSLALTSNIVIFISLIEYWMFPIRINTYGEYHGYFGLATLALVWLFINHKKRYIKILVSYKKFSDEKKNKLKVYSIIYLSLLFIGFFLTGALIRAYNINNPSFTM